MFTLDKRLSSLMIGLLLLVFTACIPQPGSIPNTGEDQTPEAHSSLANTKWRLVSFGEMGVETAVVEGSSITLEFDGEGQADGSGGCNSYSAQYEIQGETLPLGPVTSTLMVCEQEELGPDPRR